MSDVSKTMEFKMRVDGEKEALEKIKSIGETTEETVTGMQKTLTTVGASMAMVGGAMTAAFTVPIIAFGKSALMTAADFEQAMATVSAISGATGRDMEALAEVAKELGSTTRFSAVEAAGGMTMLARAGWDVNEIIAGMPGLLDLAAAGAVDLATAADIVSDVMMAFGDNADQAGRYADVFAAAASNANTTVEALGQAMAYAAPAAAAAGFSLEETAAALSALADAGIKSTRAGTTMDAVLRELRDKADEGTLSFETFGVAIYDAEGNMRSFFDILGDIEANLQGMTQAQRDAELSTVFTTRSLRGMNIFLTRGVDSLKDLERGLIDSEGASESMAGTMMGTFHGAMISLQSALEGVRIRLGEAFVAPATGVINWLTEMARSMAAMSDESVTLVTTIAIVVAAMGPLLTVFGGLVVTIGMAAKMWAGFVAVLTGPLGIIAAVTLALAALTIGTVLHLERQKRSAELWATTMEDSVQRVIDAYSNFSLVGTLTVVGDQQERHVEQLEAEFAFLVEMGELVEGTTAWQDAYDTIQKEIEILQMLRHLAQLAKEKEFLDDMADAAEDGYDKVGEVVEKHYASIQEELDATEQAHVLAFLKILSTMDLTEKQQGEILDKFVQKLREWRGDVTEQSHLAMNDFMREHQEGLLEVGKIWDYELGNTVDIADLNFKQVQAVISGALSDLPDEMHSSVLGMLREMETMPANADEIFGEIVGILESQGINWKTGGEIHSAEYLLALKDGLDIDDLLTEGWEDLDTQKQADMFAEIAERMVGEDNLGPVFTDGAAIAMAFFEAGMLEEGIEAMKPLIDLIEGGFDSIDVSPAGIKVTKDFADGIADIPRETRDIFAGIGPAMAEGIAAGAGDAGDAGEALGQSVKDRILSLFDIQSPSRVMIAIGESIGQGLAEGLTNAVSNVVDAVSAFAQSITNAFNDIKTTVSTSFKNVWADMASITKNGLNDVVNVFDNVRNSIDVIVRRISDNIRVTTGIIVDTIRSMGNNLRIIITDSIQELVADIQGTIATIISNFRTMGNDLRNIALTIGRNIVDGVMTHLRNLPNEIWRIIQNVVTRLMSAGGTLYNAAVNLGKSLWEGFKSGMGISSPSYIEKALDQITKASRDALLTLDNDTKAMTTAIHTPMMKRMHHTAFKGSASEPAVSNKPTYNLNVGTLIADDHGLKQLERKLKDLRITETRRVVKLS